MPKCGGKPGHGPRTVSVTASTFKAWAYLLWSWKTGPKTVSVSGHRRSKP